MSRPSRSRSAAAARVSSCLLGQAVRFDGGLGWENWLRLFVWLATGLVIYFTYGRHRSTIALRHELAAGGASGAGRLSDE